MTGARGQVDQDEPNQHARQALHDADEVPLATSLGAHSLEPRGPCVHRPGEAWEAERDEPGGQDQHASGEQQDGHRTQSNSWPATLSCWVRSAGGPTAKSSPAPTANPTRPGCSAPISAKAVSACFEVPAHKKPKVTTHVLRHTAASLMVAAGVPMFDVAKVLGHETIQATMRYAHFAPEAGKAAVEALDKILDLKVDADRVEERLVDYASR